MRWHSLRVLLFVLVAVIQLAVAGRAIVISELTLRSGEVYRFRIQPVDPVDAFRGRYVAVRMAENRAPVAGDLEIGTSLRGGTLESLSADSWVGLEFPDGSTVTISGQSVLTISEIDRKELRLGHGRLSASVAPQPAVTVVSACRISPKASADNRITMPGTPSSCGSTFDPRPSRRTGTSSSRQRRTKVPSCSQSVGSAKYSAGPPS